MARFKQTLVAAVFGLLFAGNALARDSGHFSGQMPGDGAAQPAEMADAGSIAPIDGGVDPDGNSAIDGSRLVQNVSVTLAPLKDWLLILAALGLVGVMVERTKRRAI